MDSDGLPLVGPGVDLAKVNAIHQKRLVAFINHFLTNSVEHLNRFSSVCEEKLTAINTKIQRLENVLNILETKINSIPGLENVNVTSSTVVVTEEKPLENETPPPVLNGEEVSTDTSSMQGEVSVCETSASNEIRNADHPVYKPYFKMQSMGVPDMAVKQKMTMAGIDPSVLDNPNRLVSSDESPSSKRSETDESDAFTDSEEDSSEQDSQSDDFSD